MKAYIELYDEHDNAIGRTGQLVEAPVAVHVKNMEYIIQLWNTEHWDNKAVSSAYKHTHADKKAVKGYGRVKKFEFIEYNSATK